MKSTTKYLAITVLLATVAVATQQKGPLDRQKQATQILDKTLEHLRQGHDLGTVDGWKAKATTTVGDQTYATNFNSSCASLIYGYRNSKESVVDSNTTDLPEFAPHLAPIVLAAEKADSSSTIRWRGKQASNARMFDIIEITPSNRDAAYASKQVWYIDEVSGVPAQIDFMKGNQVAKLYLEDYKPASDGILVPFSGKYVSSEGKQTQFHYTDIALEHGEHCGH